MKSRLATRSHTRARPRLHSRLTPGHRSWPNARARSAATGARLANVRQPVPPRARVRDRDGTGAGYVVRTPRPNVTFASFAHNNNVHGLTKNQASPAPAKPNKTNSMHEQAIQL